MVPRYDPRARDDVKAALHEHKHHGTYKSREQAIAVGLNKARAKGEHVPNQH